MESIPKSKSSRDNCFDFLRLTAAFCVLVTHSSEHLHLRFFWVGTGASSYWFYDGVALFFIMSGYLVYQSYERCVQRGRPATQYLINRVLRIAPALYAYVAGLTVLLLAIGAMPLSALHGRPFWQWSLGNMALLPLGWKSFANFGPGANGSLWTIPAEFSFYLVVPAIYFIQRRFGVRTMLATVGLVALGCIMLAARYPPESGFAARLFRLTCLPYLILFALGIFWSRFWPRAPKGGGWAFAAACIFLGIRVLRLFHEDIDPGNALFIRGSLNPFYCLTWSLPLSYLAMWIGHFGPRLFSRITGTIGDLSYGLYIWHMVVVSLALYYGLPQRWQAIPGATQTFVFSLSFAVAAASWWLVEKRALTWKPYSSRQPERAVTDAPAVELEPSASSPSSAVRTS